MMWADRLQSIVNIERRFRSQRLARWLTPGEQQRLAEIRSPQRAAQWLCGRWLGKQLLLQLASECRMALTDLHIESKNSRDRGSRPRVYREGRLQSWQLSISHSSHFVYVAAATGVGMRLGVDVTSRRALPPSFARFWLTDPEQTWCDRSADGAACILWSLKESWYKAAGGDQPFAPRQLDVVSALSVDEIPSSETSDRRRPLQLRDDSNMTVLCRWMPRDVATLVALRDTARPVAPVTRLLAGEFPS
jgi:phosphopantetheinyl transferase